MIKKEMFNKEDKISVSNKGYKWNCAADARDIVYQIQSCTTLRTLELNGNTLGVEAAEVIGNALSEHPEFERAIWKDLFTGRLKNEIPMALRHLFSGLIRANAHIIELDLSDNALGPVGMEGMVEFIKSPVCYSLQELRLNNNGLGSKGGAMLAKALLDLNDNSVKAGTPLKLKVFIVGRNKLEDDGAVSFSEFFSTVGTLEDIQMPQNSIFHRGVKVLAEAISKNKNLKTINLNDNTFTVTGATSMANYLPKLENLETINFGDCLFRNDGVKKLAASLSSGHHNLQNLHLDGNEIRLSGALAIIDAIANKSNFKLLDMECNQLGEEMPTEIFEKITQIRKFDFLFSDNEEPDSDWESNAESDIDLSHEYEFVEAEDLQPSGDEENESDPGEYSSSAAEFLRQPSISVLMALGSSASLQLCKEIKRIAFFSMDSQDIEYEEAYTSELLTGIMKVSSVSSNETLEKEMRLECSQKLWEEALYMLSSVGINIFINIILIHLGEVKSEDKKFKIQWDIRKCLQNLTWLINLPFVPAEIKLSLRATLLLSESKLVTYRNEVQQLVEEAF